HVRYTKPSKSVMYRCGVRTDVGAGFSRSRPNDSSARCGEHCGVEPAAIAARDRLKPAPTTARPPSIDLANERSGNTCETCHVRAAELRSRKTNERFRDSEIF